MVRNCGGKVAKFIEVNKYYWTLHLCNDIARQQDNDADEEDHCD